MFRIGHEYTRTEIHGVVGGSLQSYLPTKNGEVVAACLTRKYNPEAPKVILVGRGPIIESAGKLLSKQLTPIPVFIKKAVNSWEYQGQYRSVRHLINEGEMQAYVKKSERSDVVGVIFLEPV